jgi:hypothetical protein
MNILNSAVEDEPTTEIALDSQEQQEHQITDLQAKLKASPLAERDEALLNLVRALVQVVSTQKRLGIRFVSLVCTHSQIHEAMRWFEHTQHRTL